MFVLIYKKTSFCIYIMANLKFKTHTNQDQKQILNQAKIL